MSWPNLKAYAMRVIPGLLVFALVVGLIVATQNIYLRAEEKKMAKEVTREKMRTVCVGRFLLDVPLDAEVSYRPAFLAGWDITTESDETDAEFNARLEEREKELRAQKNGRGQPSLEIAQSVRTNEIAGKIFVFGRKWTHGYENGKRVEEDFVSIDAAVRGQSVSYDFSGSYFDGEDATELAKIVTQVRHRGETEIPTQAGFCFERGLMTEPLEPTQNEGLTISVTLKNHPDVSIVLSTRAGMNESTSLLERSASAREEFSQADRDRFTIFREGPRILNGLYGEEVLEKVVEHNGSTGQAFMWESAKTDKLNVFTPFLSFEMSTGHGQPGSPVATSFPDEAALALWDRMSSSIRIRPVNDATSDAPVAVDTPIGTHGMAGEVCPQSGWWKCIDAGDRVGVNGGRIQYLRTGERIPQATLLPDATAWQKIRGEQPTIQSKIPSSWKLVDRRKQTRKSPSIPLAAASMPPQMQPSDRAVERPTDAHDQLAKTSIGAKFGSGAVCPASGWWLCLELGTVDGARWFANGSLFPPATKLVSISVLAKMKGVPNFERMPATWQLIRFASSEGPVQTESNTSLTTSSSSFETGNPDLPKGA